MAIKILATHYPSFAKQLADRSVGVVKIHVPCWPACDDNDAYIFG